MNELYYEKRGCLEITTDHRQAVEWYRQGFNVDLRKIDPQTGALEIVAMWEW